MQGKVEKMDCQWSEIRTSIMDTINCSESNAFYLFPWKYGKAQ